LHLDFGQKGHEDITRCHLCGMVYAPKTADETIHKKFCASTAKSAESRIFHFVRNKDLAAVAEFDSGQGIIIQIDGSSTFMPYWSKVVCIKEQIERTNMTFSLAGGSVSAILGTSSKDSQSADELPTLVRSPSIQTSPSSQTSSSPSQSKQPLLSPSKPFLWKYGKAKAFLYVLNDQTVIGFLLAEQVSEAYYLIDMNFPSDRRERIATKLPFSGFTFTGDQNEESNDDRNKENIDPHTHQSVNDRAACTSPPSSPKIADPPLRSQRAVLGVLQLWAADSITKPSKLKPPPPNTIRQRLLHTAQDSLIYGYVIAENEIAYRFPLSPETYEFAQQFHPSPSEILCYF
jgi:hypothetical protein